MEKRFYTGVGMGRAAAASLAMLIRSGYFWDDAVNSTRYLAEKKDEISTLHYLLDFMKAYLKLGRINIISAYYYLFFYIENVQVYKALIILLILADQLIFRIVLMEFGFSLREARLGMLLIPALLQTRIYQDPVSGFYGLMQVLTAEMLLCAFFLSRWLRSGKKSMLCLSLLFFGAGLLTYEVCFPFLLMICLRIGLRYILSSFSSPATYAMTSRVLYPISSGYLEAISCSLLGMSSSFGRGYTP